jgi:hypothetical protein
MVTTIQRVPRDQVVLQSTPATLRLGVTNVGSLVALLGYNRFGGVSMLRLLYIVILWGAGAGTLSLLGVRSKDEPIRRC